MYVVSKLYHILYSKYIQIILNATNMSKKDQTYQERASVCV